MTRRIQGGCRSGPVCVVTAVMTKRSRSARRRGHLDGSAAKRTPEPRPTLACLWFTCIRTRSSGLHRHPMAYMGGLDRADQGVKTVHVNLLPSGRMNDDTQHL